LDRKQRFGKKILDENLGSKTKVCKEVVKTRIWNIKQRFGKEVAGRASRF
jgi:hypothetical protein